MKKNLFQIVWIVAEVAIVALNVYFIVSSFSGVLGSEGVFIDVCFFMCILPCGYLVFLLLQSFSKGTYFLPNLFFEKDGSRNKAAYIIFGIGSFLALFGFVYFLLALVGVNPFVPALTKMELELVVSVLAFLFCLTGFSFAFGLIHFKDGCLRNII